MINKIVNNKLKRMHCRMNNEDVFIDPLIM
jgi:hypothetical protein